jgi:FMN-dependent NADH-azoreductase
MYNFTIPSQLKPWIDTLAAPGKTFRYTEKGPEGLVGRIKVIIASTRGDSYSPGAPAAVMDYQETYLAGFFRFIGITDLTFIRAEGIGLGPEKLQTALESARAVTALLVAQG